MTDPAHRRATLADAAVEVIAHDGIRALTHRAVDAAAALPTGTTSYHFRTRRDLLTAVVTRVAEISATRLREADLGPTGGLPRTHADRLAEAARIADRCSGYIQARLTRDRTLTLARYALQLELSADPELRDLLAAGQYLESMAADSVRRIGARRPKRAGRYLVAFVEGMTYHHLVGTPAPTITGPAVDRDSIRLGLLSYLLGVIPPP